MAKKVKLGVTDRTVLVFIPDPASTDGSGKTGLAHTVMTVSGTRVETDNDVVITDYTASMNALTNLTDAHNDWGWKEVSSTLAPGLYRLDIADAIFAAGAWYAVVYVMVTSSEAAASPIEFELIAYDPLDAVRFGLTALPNAAADAAGGLPISDAGGLDLDAQIGTKINDILTDTGTTLDGRIPAALVGGRMDANVGAISSDATAADNAEAFFDGTGYAGTNNVIPTVTTLSGHTPQTGDCYARLGAPAGASVSADILTIDNLVDDLESRIGTPSNLGSGATVAANLADIEGQTDDIGALGAGLTAVPWNAAWDAEVQSEVDDALVAQRLDELLNADSDIDGAAPPTVGSVFHELMTKTAGSFTYDQTTDSLEAIRDKETDIETDTQDIQTRIPAALTADGNIKADILKASVVPSEPASPPNIGTATLLDFMAYWSAVSVNEINVDSNSADIRNEADNANIATYTLSDNGTTFVNGPAA